MYVNRNSSSGYLLMECLGVLLLLSLVTPTCFNSLQQTIHSTHQILTRWIMLQERRSLTTIHRQDSLSSTELMMSGNHQFTLQGPHHAPYTYQLKNQTLTRRVGQGPPTPLCDTLSITDIIILPISDRLTTVTLQPLNWPITLLLRAP